MRLNIVLISLALLLMILDPAAAIGMSSSSGSSGSSGCVARNAIEAYCVNHGGCPKEGNCYFMDGSYCDLKSFYNGTCPDRAYYENSIWMAEAYAFLYGDYNPQGAYYVPGASSSYYNYPYAYQISNPYGYPGKESSYYWPVYAPGYGAAYGSAYGTGYGTGKYTS